MTKLTQKQRLQQAYDIHASAHHYMGYLMCDGEEDLLCFRRWVLKQKREEKNKIKKIIKEGFVFDDTTLQELLEMIDE